MVVPLVRDPVVEGLCRRGHDGGLFDQPNMSAARVWIAAFCLAACAGSDALAHDHGAGEALNEEHNEEQMGSKGASEEPAGANRPT